MKPTYVFVACPGRSGSTLLALLLASHRSVSSVSELAPARTADLQRYRCSCGELYLECPFWLAVEERLRRGKYPYTLETSADLLRYQTNWLRRLMYYPLPSMAANTLRDLVFSGYHRVSGEAARLTELSWCLAEAVMGVEQSSVFVDGMKEYSRFRLLAKAASANRDMTFRVIHLVRDPRGVVASLRRTAPSGSIERYVRYWVRSHRNTERVKRQYLPPGQTMVLRYSALCAEPARQMKRIGEFLGIDDAFDVQNLVPSRYHVIGNNMRLKPIRSLREDSRWKTELSEADLTAIRRVAGRSSACYGIDL